MLYRDQELRFTVHESQDYYKLKVSVFNDDKKTDLIGEAWVDLKNVIVPGGGQSDLWHQLQYRAKYAGEVRIELTYYDIRPPNASVLNKRGQSDNANPLSDHKSSSKANGNGEVKHFGPREIRRRPLPPDPTGRTPPRPPMPEVHSSPIPHSQGHIPHEGDYPQWAPDRDFHAPDSYSVPGDNHDESNPFDFELPRERIQSGLGQSNRFQNTRGVSKSFDDYQTPPKPRPREYSDSTDQGVYDVTSDDNRHGNQGLEERRHSAQPAIPSQNRQYPNSSSPYGSSPVHGPFRPAPSSNDLRQRAQINRYSTSPIKNDVFKDSPLKQSMSQTEFPRALEEPQDMNEDEAPPPPPAHRSSADRASSSSTTYQNSPAASIPEPLSISSTPVRTLPNVRSPLQNIERTYDPLLQNQASTPSPSTNRSGGYVAYSKPTYAPDATRHRGRSDTSPSYSNNMPQSLRSGYQPTVIDAEIENDLTEEQVQDAPFMSPLLPSYGTNPTLQSPLAPREREHNGLNRPDLYRTPDHNSMVDDHSPIGQDREGEVYGTMRPDSISSRDRDVYGDRYSPNTAGSSEYTNNRLPQSNHGPSSYGGRYPRSPLERHSSSEPYQSARNGVSIFKARTVSPDDRNIHRIPVRKSVSPNSAMEFTHVPERRLSGIPFSPDSYDVLNPSTNNNSSATTPSHPGYETPEQAAEAARQREVEKLREVGPIIGNDGRVIDPSDHLPTDTWAPEPERKPKKPEVVIRFKTGNNTMPRTPQSAGPGPSPRPQSMYGSSPGSVDTPSYGHARSGRNRLQKSNPTRPLPSQPYATSSPAVPVSSSSPYHTPSPRNPARNSFSEYPLRENQNFSNNPYGGGGESSLAPPRPAKVPLSAEDVGMDALAREMQSIDIGIGSGGRGLRTRRGY